MSPKIMSPKIMSPFGRCQTLQASVSRPCALAHCVGAPLSDHRWRKQGRRESGRFLLLL